MNLGKLGMLVAVVAAAAPASAGIIRHDVSDSQYLSLANQYSSVGRVGITGSGFTASGVLIADNWVLTAAHLMDSNLQPTTFTVGGNSYNIAERIVHPAYNGNLSAGNDIALFRLGSSVSGVTPATIFTGTTELGGVGTSVGFGMTGDGLTGINYSVSAGTKRAGRNSIDALGSVFGIDADILLYDFDRPTNNTGNSLGSSTALDMEYLIAFGDSGGGLFQEFDGITTLTGITSFIASIDGSTDGSYSDLAGSTRVSSYTQFIQQHVASAVFIPEPATLGLLVFGVMPLVRRRG